MRFRRDAPLDPGQITDVSGRGVGPGGLAIGGGGLGGIALVIYLLFALIGGGNSLGGLAPLDGQQVGQGNMPREVATTCRTGQDANEHEPEDDVMRGVLDQDDRHSQECGQRLDSRISR